MDREKVLSNYMWRLLERFGAQGVSLIVSLILARMLNPSAYGTIALVSVFLAILQVFVDSGLGTALIQKREADELDFSSVFYFNLCMCLVIYSVLFFAAPSIAEFFGIKDLAQIIRVIGVIIIISGVKGIQQAYVSRTMQFKKFFFATIGGTIISAIIGIYMAYKGFGVWALVAQNISNITVDTIILWITVQWRPKLRFSLSRLKVLLSYGWKILASSLISVIYANLRQLLIGKIYTTDELAYYNKGQEFSNKIVPNIETAVANVLLPTIAKEQDNLGIVLSITRKSVKLMSYLIWPMMIGMAVCGKHIVLLLLTEKWIACVPYLQLFCIEAAFWPISAIYNNTLKAIGRSDIILKVQVIVRVAGISMLCIAITFGPFSIAVCAFLVTLLEFAIVVLTNSKIIHYKFRDQINDIVPSALLASFMGGMVILVGKINLNYFSVLGIQIVVGIIVYLLGSIMMRLEAFFDLLDIIQRKVK